MKKIIIKNTGVISLGTNASRILGLVRDVLIAKLFGTTYEAGAFVVAFTIPNMLRDFVGEGAANAAFVPVLAEYKVKEEKTEFWKVANIIQNLLAIVLIVLSILGIFLSPIIVRIIAPGFIKEAGAIELTVRLTRFIFPYIFLIGLTAYGMSVLNILGHFAIPAFGPVLLNISLILSAIFLCPRIGVIGLVFGVLLGGILQLAIQFPWLYKNGFRLRWYVDILHPVAKKVIILLFPRVIGTAVYQINVLVDRMLASLFWIVGTGGVPALYFSYRLIQYPLAVFSTALATATLPMMSSEVAGSNMPNLKRIVCFSLRTIMFILVPSSVGLAVLGKPIIKILFERGAFDAYSTAVTYQALLFYTIGLFAYGSIRILATTFYSMKDTVTPVKVAACSLMVNIALNLILMWPLKIGGLALATSIAAIFNLAVLYLILRKRLGDLEDKELFASAAKIILASIPMGIIVYLLSKSCFEEGIRMSALSSTMWLLFIVGVGIIIYIIAAIMLGMEEPRKMFKWIFKKA